MKVPKELVEQWEIDWQDPDAKGSLNEYIAYRAAEWALSQPVSMEPYCYEVVKAMCDTEFSRTKVKDAILNEPLYTADQLAAARQQGAEEVENKWLNDIMKMTERIADLEKSNAVLLEALPKQLDAVIAWLENGCSPTEAAKELRIYDDRIHAAIAEVKP